jgi:hypothetical protein
MANIIRSTWIWLKSLRIEATMRKFHPSIVSLNGCSVRTISRHYICPKLLPSHIIPTLRPAIILRSINSQCRTAIQISPITREFSENIHQN